MAGRKIKFFRKDLDMKFLIINTDYPKFSHWLYAQHSGLEKQSYEQQYRIRMDGLFGTADFFSSNLKKLGYDAWDVIANSEPMQKQWGREHGVSSEKDRWRLRLRRGFVPWLYREDNKTWLYSILAEQVKAYKPDVIYSMAMETIGDEFLQSVKGYYRLAVVQHAAPLSSCGLSEYDLALSSLPNQVDYFRGQGMRAEQFRLGFESRILKSLSPTNKPFDIVFVGGLGKYHRQGVCTLEELSKKYHVGVWGYGIEGLSKASPIHHVFHGSIWGLDMYQVLHNAKLVFNRHLDISGDFANNMRLYETTGVGSLLLTDEKKNLSEIFSPGREVITYRNMEECLELAGYYLMHENEREAVARAGQERTLREHTWYHRMQELIDIVERYL